MIQPDFLQKGDTVAILSTARKITMQEIEPAVKILQDFGLKIKIGRTVGLQCCQFAGEDTERVKDFQEVLDDNTIKAIICARGGYGTVRIIDKLDFTRFLKEPKWIVGYSDITVLHSHIHTNCNVPTLHAIMPVNFPADGSNNISLDTLRKALFGEKINYHYPYHLLNRKGNAQGILIGGNLSVIYSLTGTQSDINTTGKILFLEDLEEYIYHVDRMIINLKRSGKLSGLKGLIIGGMTKMRDNEIPYGKTAEEIISEHVAEYKYPVSFGFPAGHPPFENRALFLGKEIQLSVNEYCTLSFSPQIRE